jgi:transposase
MRCQRSPHIEPPGSGKLSHPGSPKLSEFFGGVPRRVVLDNLRAAIVHAALHDPEVQRSYREFAEHYGFLIAPCRPRTPEHKGKVEQGGVHYVKRNAR